MVLQAIVTASTLIEQFELAHEQDGKIVLWLKCGWDLFSVFFPLPGTSGDDELILIDNVKPVNSKKRPYIDVDSEPTPKRATEKISQSNSIVSHRLATQTHLLVPVFVKRIVRVFVTLFT